MSERPSIESGCSTKYIAPVVESTLGVFEMMLNCTPQRSGVVVKDSSDSPYKVGAFIVLTGSETGVVALRLSEQLALETLRQMLGTDASQIDSEVLDAVAELANMVGGGVKASLEHLALSMGVPTVITETNSEIPFPPKTRPLCVLFE